MTFSFKNYFMTPFFYSKDSSKLELELIWNCLILGKYSDLVNKQNEKISRYEALFFTDNYMEADKKLQEIEKEQGVSLWLFENKMLLEEFYSNDSAIINRNIVQKYSENDNSFQTFLLNKIFERVSDDSSFEKYSERVKKEIEDSNIPIEMKLFSVFWLDFHNFPDENDALQSILVIGSNTSLADRYNMVVRVMQKMSINKYNWKILNECLEILSDIDDSRLDKLSAICQQESSYLNLRQEDLCFNKILDEYTEGNYEKVQYLIKEFYKDEPRSFKVVEIYNKSLLLSNRINKELQFDFDSKVLKQASEL